MNHAAMMAAAQSRDAKAQAALYAHIRGLAEAALGRKDPNAWEDIATKVFMAVLETKPKSPLKDDEAVKRYLMRAIWNGRRDVARSEASDRRRSDRLRAEPTMGYADDVATSQDDQHVDALELERVRQEVRTFETWFEKVALPNIGPSQARRQPFLETMAVLQRIANGETTLDDVVLSEDAATKVRTRKGAWYKRAQRALLVVSQWRASTPSEDLPVSAALVDAWIARLALKNS
jgi:hypothetical protein